ncbi:MAG: hypothetical protein PUD36_01140 [Bacteroidales bacterium]|nr:hypothetical protein [Bacteroidales bacterium]
MRIGTKAKGLVVVVGFMAQLMCSCGTSDNAPQIVVDMNRMVRSVATLRSVAADGDTAMEVRPDANGVYVLSTTCLPTGIYHMQWLEGLDMPLYVITGQEIKVCATPAEWDRKSTSSTATALLWKADSLRQMLQTGRDTIYRHLEMVSEGNAMRMAAATTSKGAKGSGFGKGGSTTGVVPFSEALDQWADTLLDLRQRVRRLADSLMTMTPDTSLVNLAIMGLDGIYDAAEDHALMQKRTEGMSQRHGSVPEVASLRSSLAEVGILLRARERYKPGNEIADYKFFTASDTLTGSEMTKVRHALVIIEDTTKAERVKPLMNALAQNGTRVLVEAPKEMDLEPKPQQSGKTGDGAQTKKILTKAKFIRGKFKELPDIDALRHFAPAMVVICADGTVESLRLGEHMRTQHGFQTAPPKEVIKKPKPQVVKTESAPEPLKPLSVPQMIAPLGGTSAKDLGTPPSLNLNE